MFPSYQNSAELLNNALESDLYFQLIKQLNKDFSLANLNFNFNENSTPFVLKEKLQEAINNIILNDSNSFNSLLYIIDVSEKDLINSDIEKITFLILKRTWKKVWFRNKFSN